MRQNGLMLQELSLPYEMHTADSVFILRDAVDKDLVDLTRLLSDDPISAGREDVGSADNQPQYLDALRAITSAPDNALLVATDGRDKTVATMQLTRIPGLARRGAWRLQVEAVRVSSDQRSSGIGGAMMRWVTGTAAGQLGCTLVQLTSDTARVDAHRFYERLGFVPSHVGFKYAVTPR